MDMANFIPDTLLLQSDGNIFTLSLSNGEKKYLTSDGGPNNQYIFASWSLNGSRIVYTKSQPPDMYIWTMNADGSNQKQLTYAPLMGSIPSFSPDGKLIQFSSFATGTPELWLMNADGSDPHPLTHTTGSEIAKDGVTIKWSEEGSFSPDGTKIVYSSTESGHAEIWVMNIDGSDKKQLTFSDDPEAPDANNPIYSPDGSKIVFFGGFATISGHIFSMNPDGSDRTQLTQRPGDDPSWSPDSQEIFFDSPGLDGVNEAWIMNKDGSDQRPLSSSPIFPSRVPAITKLKAVTVPDDLNTAQQTGFNFQDITPLGSATESPDISATRLNQSSTAESCGVTLAMDHLNEMWNDNGDVGGCGDGCY